MPVGRPNADRLERRTLVPKLQKARESQSFFNVQNWIYSTLICWFLPIVLFDQKVSHMGFCNPSPGWNRVNCKSFMYQNMWLNIKTWDSLPPSFVCCFSVLVEQFLGSSRRIFFLKTFVTTFPFKQLLHRQVLEWGLQSWCVSPSPSHQTLLTPSTTSLIISSQGINANIMKSIMANNSLFVRKFLVFPLIWRSTRNIAITERCGSCEVYCLKCTDMHSLFCKNQLPDTFT